MARLKKEQRPELIKGGYSAIPWVVLDSLSFKGASDKAKSLLFAVMRQHNGSNNGHLHMAKKWLYKQGWTCDENNRKACHELIERSLIVQTKWGGLNLGANLYALTWHDITNYAGLDISPKGYSRGLYSLCDLPPTKRRRPPARKQVQRHDVRDSLGSASGLDGFMAGTANELVGAISKASTGSTTENNVFIPLPHNKIPKRIVGVKGKSGISKVNQANEMAVVGLLH